jgi:ubiquinone/menaquinone biosynthesis C-methylase UbiE
MKNSAIVSRLASVAAVAALLAPVGPTFAAMRRGQEIPAKVEPASPPKEPARRLYMGRPIAPTMSYEGGPWLMRATREKEERCSKLLAALEIASGAIVCDFGCGNGFYTFALAEKVGEKGKVYATDIQPEMLELLEKEGARDAARRALWPRVVPVLSTETDPKLPDGSIDLALLVDVYHELSDPEAVLRALARALKPKGQAVIVEFRLEDPEVPIKLDHKMTKAQLKLELDRNGYDVVREYDELPWQHVVFFTPRREPVPPPAPGGAAAAKDQLKERSQEPSNEPSSERSREQAWEQAGERSRKQSEEQSEEQSGERSGERSTASSDGG